MHSVHFHSISLVLVCLSFILRLQGQESTIRLNQDERLGGLLGEEGDFLFEPYASKEEWLQRQERLKSILQVTLGLWPPPARTPLVPIIHGRRAFDGYAIEKVILESAPGFFLTGNLYRPLPFEPNKKHAAVLSPHGHFPNGRFIDEGELAVRKKIAVGAERFEIGGRSFMQSRCVQLARMGCVVFHYDMVGYGDSVQIPLDVAHRFPGLRRTFKRPPTKGFYSARAEQHMFNPMGLHVWNSQRALDFLADLPDVDPERIAVTGGSGGGTQTFMLCAVDDRPLVSVPVVILSSTRQGGCTCENISGLRWGSYNLEFAALHAPKPQLLISAWDDTRTMSERGFPELREHYRMLGSESLLAHKPLLHFPHNYNYVSRTSMYHWLNKHLRLDLAEPIMERDYPLQSRDELTLWDEEHPRPEPDPGFVDRLGDWFAEDARRQIAALTPDHPKQMQTYREVIGKAWSVILRTVPHDVYPKWEGLGLQRHDSYLETRGVLRYQTFNGHMAQLPIVRLEPLPSVDRSGRALIWFDSVGKDCLYQENGGLQPEVLRALGNGHEVISADLLLQGGYLEGEPAPLRQDHLPGEEAFAGWTYCYNLPLFAQRAYDVMALIKWAEHADARLGGFGVLGTGSAGPIVGAASALVQSGKLRRTSIETNGFRFEHIDDVYNVDFLPGAVKYGDLPGLLALTAPRALQISGESEGSLTQVRAAYHAEGKQSMLHFRDRNRSAAISWVLQ